MQNVKINPFHLCVSVVKILSGFRIKCGTTICLSVIPAKKGIQFLYGCEPLPKCVFIFREHL